MTGQDDIGPRMFGSSHMLANRLAWPALGFLAFGMAVVAVSGSGDTMLTGLALAALGVILGGVVAVRLASPPVFAVVVSNDGVVFRDVSPRIIPWEEIQAVELRKVHEVSAPGARDVASIAVSRSFFAALSAKTAWPPEVVSIGEPTWLHLAYHRHDVPAADLAALIARCLAGTGRVD